MGRHHVPALGSAQRCCRRDVVDFPRSGFELLGYGAPFYGIKTGLNDAFVVDRATRNRLAIDAAHAALLVPFLRGEDVKRWRVESEDLFLINIPRDYIRIEDYPAIEAHLLPFRAKLEARATRQAWFELQQAQLAYQPAMHGAKIIYPHFADRSSFAPDTGSFSNNKTYFVPSDDAYLLGLLNSAALWFVFTGLTTAVRGGFREHTVQHIEQLPVPEVDTDTRVMLSRAATTASVAASAALALEREVQLRIPDLCSSDRSPKLNRKLIAWWMLDFAAFRAEVNKTFGADIPLRQRTEWEAYLNDKRASLMRQTAEIKQAEREIGEITGDLFNLTAAEKASLA